ncbi:hypothetical protein [Dyadobacter alkalitolerans]|uniref:hypothetical protein n=1 Tax=Dyadobacter alkalitolerans TaxID=492736 RepID=UPI000419C652|nr:hypothetical protein [Dyadobacter alkalitolerans]
MNTLQESKENGPIGSNAQVNAQNIGAAGLNFDQIDSQPLITSTPSPSDVDKCKAEIRELKSKMHDLEVFKHKMACFLAETELSADFNEFVLPGHFVNWGQAYDEKYRSIEYKILSTGKKGAQGLHAADKDLLSLYNFMAEYLTDEPVANTAQLLNTILINVLSRKEPDLDKDAIQMCRKTAELSSFLLKLDLHFQFVESEMEPWCKRSIFYSPDSKTRLPWKQN